MDMVQWIRCNVYCVLGYGAWILQWITPQWITPQWVVMEGLNAPNKLNFNVSQQWLDTAMYAKALKLVKEHEKFILRGDTQAHGATTAGYVLSMGQMDDHPNITYGLVKKCVPPMPTCLLCPRASYACPYIFHTAAAFGCCIWHATPVRPPP